MPENILQIVGAIAGIGGISLGILLIIFRDFIRRFIQANVFTTLPSSQATLLLGATIIFTFAIAIVGIFAGFVEGGSATSFILLVVIVLIFILVVLYIVTREMLIEKSPINPFEDNVFWQVRQLLEQGKVDEAEQKLNKANNRQGEAEYWYWKAEIASERYNLDVALVYSDEALKRNEQHIHSLALKVKLLLLNGNVRKAKTLADASYGIDDALDVWISCLRAQNLFSGGPWTRSELDNKCQFPAYVWDKN